MPFKSIIRSGSEAKRVMIFLILLAGLLAYLNWQWEAFTQETAVTRREPPPDAALVTMPVPPPGVEIGDFYVETRLERDRSRSEQEDLLRSIIADENTTPEARAAAQGRLIELKRRAAGESEAESLIRAKGFPDAIVFLNDQGAVVVMKIFDLQAKDAARVADVTSTATGVPFEQVKIIPYVQ